VNDKSYDVQYTINNANGEAAEYSVVAVASLPLGVTLNRALPTTCDVSGGVASLAANQHCIIDLTFNASNLTVGPYTGHVLDVHQTQPPVSLPLILSTTITAAPPPLVPMQLTTQQDIPALVTEGITYNMFYQLHNPNATTASYTLTQYNIPGVNLVTAQTTPCALKVGQLAANASCTIEATFAVTPATAPVGLYNQHIFVLNADGGVTPDSVWLKTIVQHYFAHNVIVFGDSLSDIGNTSLAPYTNDADSGRYTWIQYLAQNALLLPSHDIVASNLLGTQTAVDTNVDYAVGGATTANFPAQLAQYKAQLKQPLANPTTWVFLWMGGNDLLFN
jgi:hypothetical protein